MINLDLNSVINILSLDEYSKMTLEVRRNLIGEEGVDEDEIFDYLRDQYIGMKLSYIEEKVRVLYQLPIMVSGVPEELISCPCCNYKTISEKGNYEICPVCFWEDDGRNSDDLGNSSVNHMTLKEAKDNFREVGAISEKFLKYISDDAKLKYYKSESL